MYVCTYVHKVEISVLNEIQTNCFSKITKYSVFLFFLFSKVLTNKNSYIPHHNQAYICRYVHMYIHALIESIFQVFMHTF